MKITWNEILFGFGDKTIETQFIQDYFDRFSYQIKIGLLISISIYLIFYFIDVWVFTAIEPQLLMNRIIVTTAFALLFLISFTGFFKKNMQLLILLFGIIATLGILWKLNLLHKNGFDFSFFFPGLILISAIVSFYMRIRFLYATLLNVFIIAAYTATFVFFIYTFQDSAALLLQTFVNSLFFLVCSSFLCLFASYYLEKESRQAFVVQIEIEDINTNLESIVRQRTSDLEIEKRKNISMLIDGQERESSRVARELHDGINSQLALLKFDLEQQSKIGNYSNMPKTIDNLLKINNDVRNIAHQHSSWTLQKHGLSEALRLYLSNIIAQTSLEFKLHLNAHDGQIPEKVAVALYRVFQEAINNIIKHADASEVEIQLIKTDDAYNLSIVDNGKGFVVNTHHNGGLGIENMKIRIEQENKGTLIIDSTPGQGTTLIANVNI